ncbi:acyltransferase [Acinetobacter bouvetii]|uniref:Galactoside O-acetyltransferase n=1 Tax=Acinetobacter bouvetii TaxID=202951 RepID=A0A811GL94_9GAMM|nr:acyltransferase [Acinetobacter bouvetii]CAB1220535.1 Galactoside O-acetyltransferase [Acinetobacter bouvetii]
MFFKVLKLMNWFTAQCRKALYNQAFSTNFKYFGKGSTLEIAGQVKIGKNVYIGDHVSLIVEAGASLTIADNSFIGESCYIKCFGGDIAIGREVSINSKSFINGCGGVSIGDNTRIGTQSIIIASNHKFDDPDTLVKDQISKQGVSLGENIWLGARVTVLDGVHIPDNSVIGACSLVSKTLNESGVYVGVPARKIK